VTLTQLAAYLGPAVLYAAVLTILIFWISRGVVSWRGRGRKLQLRDSWLIGLVVFFLFLTQYPFPDSSSLDCSQGGARPILQPFAILSRFLHLARHADGLRPWIGDKVVQSSGMNFLLCGLIGFALERYLHGRYLLLQAFFLGALLSLTAEILQLTGVLWLYPCPYRQFEVDDLILNIGGVMAGIVFARWKSRLRSQVPRG
jgi:glycopeptide antibiotics resistance protein